MRGMLADFLQTKNVLSKAELEKIRANEKSDDLVTAMANVCEIITGEKNKKVLTGEKSFREHPFNVIDYERRGLHVARVVFARYAFEKRKGPVKYLKSGLVRVPKLVGDKAQVKTLFDKMHKVPASVSKTDLNLVNTQSDFKVIVNLARPHIMKQLRRVDKKAEGFLVNNAYVQRVTNQPDDKDVQKVAHSDTFFPALKWWWFPEAVREGVFCYAEKSPMLTPELLEFHYNWSMRVIRDEENEKWRGHGQLEGSFRFSEQELTTLGLKLVEQEVEADTLIIANVFGVHARGNVTKKSERFAVHGSIRFEDPFL